MLSFKSLTVPIRYHHPLSSKQDATWVGAAANEDDSLSVSDKNKVGLFWRCQEQQSIAHVQVLSRQHYSSCTVMCHHWQTATCTWLVLISPSLACRSTLRSSLLSIMWSYAMGILCNSLQCWWSIYQLKDLKRYPRERLAPVNEGLHANKGNLV